MDKLQFETNLPRELRLQYTEGKLVNSTFGGNQYLFSTDQGPFYVSEAVGNILHDQIRRQNVLANEPVEICKREVDQGRGRKGIQWQLTKLGFTPGEQPDGTFAVPNPSSQGRAGAGVPASAPAQTAASQPPTSNTGNGSKPNGHGNANGPAQGLSLNGPKLPLEVALKAVVASVHAAQEYAKEIGYALPQFTSEDIRTMANTLVMEGRRG